MVRVRDSLSLYRARGKRCFGLNISVVLLVLMDLFLAGSATGQDGTAVNDAAAQAELELARSYRQNNQYPEATQAFTDIIPRYPQTDYALHAYQDLSLMQVELGLVESVESTRQGLIQNFTDHPDISRAVTHIGDAWRQQGSYTQAIAVYNDVSSRWPGKEHAMWSAMGRAICYAHQNDDAAAQAEVDAMIPAFSDQKWLARAVCIVGDEYRKMEKWDKSRIYYRYVVENRPQADFALWAGMGRAIASIRVNDLENAAQSFDKLLADFPQDTRMANAANQIADEYRLAQQYEEACPLYHYVVDQWPQAQQALWSRMGLAIANIAMDDPDRAAQSTEKLLADFPQDKRLPDAACQIAHEYRRVQKHENACDIYQQIIQTWPQNEQALWARMGQAISLLKQDQSAEAIRQIDQMLAAHPQDKRISAALCQIGDAYYQESDWETARNYYQYIADHWPDTEHEIWGYSGVIRCNIRLNQVDDIDAAVNAFIAKFSDHPALANAIFVMGEEYYNIAMRMVKQGDSEGAAENFATALPIWQIIVDSLPESDHAPHAHYFVAVCHRRLLQFPQAVEYWQKVVDRWPNFSYAGSAQSLVASYTRVMRDRGDIPAEQADPLIQFACENIIANYKHCPSTPHVYELALKRLGGLHLKNSRWQEAAMYYETYRLEFPQFNTTSIILYNLVEIYESMGEPALAIDVCEEFIQYCPEDRRIDRIRSKLYELTKGSGG